MIAPFVDMPTWATTYKIAGGALSTVVQPLEFSNQRILVKKTRIANYVRRCEETIHTYQVTLIHAKDDTDIP
jgi:hypothetical protein